MKFKTLKKYTCSRNLAIKKLSYVLTLHCKALSFLRKVGEEQHRNFSFLLSAGAVPGHPYRAAPVHQERCVFKIYKVKKISVVNERSLSPQNSLKQKETTKKKVSPRNIDNKIVTSKSVNVVIKVRQTCQKCQKEEKLLKFFFRQITSFAAVYSGENIKFQEICF